MIYHNSQDLECKSPFGAVPVSSEVKITVNADYACGAVLRTWTEENGEYRYEMHREEGDDFSVNIKMPDYGTLVWYYFIIYYPSGDTCLYGAPSNKLGGIGQEYRENPESFQITVYKPIQNAKWFKDSVMYQIFPDRFNKGSDFESRESIAQRHIVDDWYSTPSYIKDEQGNVIDWTFYGGTLKGIEEKLDYLQDLGISTIYLNPIFKANSNHRYDTSDYMQIDPLLGDEESYMSLCSEAKKRNMHIILDGVFSHVGRHSKYFEEEKYQEWFKKDENGNNVYWWGVKDLPEVNELSPSYLNYICGDGGVIDKWISLGASGFRLDVADELPDEFIKHIRTRIKESNSDSILIGEVWEDASNKFSHGEKRKYLMGEELDSIMNYPLRTILLDFAEYKCDAFTTIKRFMSLYENYPKEILYSTMNLLSSHDRVRLLTVLDSNDDMLRMLYALLFYMPGVPCIYYGDEAGLEGYFDPQNRACYPWGKENNELVTFFKSLIKEYNEHSSLKDGDFSPLYLNENVLSFIRKNEDEQLLVLANRTDSNITVILGGKEYEIPAYRTICRNI